MCINQTSVQQSQTKVHTLKGNKQFELLEFTFMYLIVTS